MKFFNTSGPVNPQDHYVIPPLKRWDLENILMLIEQKKYFVLHAPRQTGKTSCLLALADYLNAEGKYKALYINVEPAQVAREDTNSGIHTIVDMFLAYEEQTHNTGGLSDKIYALKKNTDFKSFLFNTLKIWTEFSDRPTVLFIDEIDTLVGDTLISVLRQLRAGYTQRPAAFPQSIMLCGVRDVRDYRMDVQGSGKEMITGGSAFNIKDKSLRLGNFHRNDIEVLYNEHSQATGQQFEKGYLDLVWQYTGGQPWLVNALAYETCFEMKTNRDRTKLITLKAIKEAKENLILRRDTHLDQLSDKLKEPRVHRIIEPILSGNEKGSNLSFADVEYCIDLGLIIKEGNLKIANQIYREVIPRELVLATQVMLVQESVWYVESASGRLQMNKLLTEFQNFYRKHSEHWLQGMSYTEAGPQLLLQAFLQRIVNGEGIVEREYGLGRRRTDLYICWFPEGKDNYDTKQEIVIECKVLYESLEETINKGLEQVSAYADKCGAKESYLIIFDKDSDRIWDDKIFQKQMNYGKRDIIIWGM